MVDAHNSIGVQRVSVWEHHLYRVIMIQLLVYLLKQQFCKLQENGLIQLPQLLQFTQALLQCKQVSVKPVIIVLLEVFGHLTALITVKLVNTVLQAHQLQLPVQLELINQIMSLCQHLLQVHLATLVLKDFTVH